MPEQLLTGPDISSPLQRMRGKAVSERMARHALGDPQPPDCCFDPKVRSRLHSMELHITPEPVTVLGEGF